jgi:hypothetical protein
MPFENRHGLTSHELESGIAPKDSWPAARKGEKNRPTPTRTGNHGAYPNVKRIYGSILRVGLAAPARGDSLAGIMPQERPKTPMTLGNMRANGVRSLIVTCLACRHSADLVADALADELHVPEVGRRIEICPGLAHDGADGEGLRQKGTRNGCGRATRLLCSGRTLRGPLGLVGKRTRPIAAVRPVSSVSGSKEAGTPLCIER